MNLSAGRDSGYIALVVQKLSTYFFKVPLRFENFYKAPKNFQVLFMANK